MTVRFDPEKEVPSLELCWQLKNLGFPQEGGGWYWCRKPSNAMLDDTYKQKRGWGLKYCNWTETFEKYLAEERHMQTIIKAPTVRELGGWIKIAWGNMPVEIKTNCHYPYFPSEIDPNLLAEDLIWLAENGYVRFKEEVQHEEV